MRRHFASPASLVLWILAGFALLRLVLMLGLGLGNDEAYTIVGARGFHLSYFDHPPLHVWLAHVAAQAFGETRWVRLPFVLLFAGTGWLLFGLTRRLYGAQAGVWAVLALNLTPFFTLSPGGWVVPDGPLLFFLLAAVLVLVPAVLGDLEETPDRWRPWIVGGLCFGLAGLSKYGALPIALSLMAFMVASPRGRRWLTHPAPYAGAAVAGLVILPVLVWNADNGWVSLAFQTGRGLPRARAAPRRSVGDGARRGGSPVALDRGAADRRHRSAPDPDGRPPAWRCPAGGAVVADDPGLHGGRPSGAPVGCRIGRCPRGSSSTPCSARGLSSGSLDRAWCGAGSPDPPWPSRSCSAPG